MKKFLKIGGIVVVVLILVVGGVLFYVASNLDRIVADLIEEHGSAATGTPVHVSGVSIDLRDATGSISGLTIANPDGFGRDAAIEFGSFTLRLDAGSLFSDPIVVENVDVDAAVLRIEQIGRKNNLQTLLNNLRGEPATEPADPETAGPRVVIERFALTGTSASLSVPELDEQRTVEVPDVVLTGIGRKSGGATGAELARQILEPVIRESLQSSAAQAAEQRLRDELKEQVGESAGELLRRLGDRDDDEPEE